MERPLIKGLKGEVMRDNEKWAQKKKSGFEDDPAPARCPDREHEPPSHMVIPQGKIYRHICPNCGRETVLRPSQVFMGSHESVKR